MNNEKKYYLGCSGWYYNDWKERFYPQKLSKSKWLEYYSEKFNTVEVNNTFYRFPNEKTVKGWYKRTPENFKFTIKANQTITHRRRFKDTQNTIKRFYGISNLLEDKLSCILFQIPPNISKNIDFLKNALKQLDPSKNNTMEFRHSSWFDDEVYEILKEFNVTFCSVSSAELPEKFIITSDIGYIRFHGKGQQKYQYFYKNEELDKWSEKIEKTSLKNVFCYFNNDYNANAPENCLTLKEKLDYY
jgi:uncharacterized protein YecE (DUF72 family)